MGTKVPTGAVCELLLLRQVKGDTWSVWHAPASGCSRAQRWICDGSLTAVVDETLPDGNKYVTFSYDAETLYEKLDEFGKMPLPPYITKQLEDQSQYQTVYAKELGSAAAPTAGLHFTPQLMDTIRSRGVNIAEVTLHVGLGTFRPVNEEDIEDHQMHSEWYSLSARRLRSLSMRPVRRAIASLLWAQRAAARWKLSGITTVKSCRAAAIPASLFIPASN